MSSHSSPSVLITGCSERGIGQALARAYLDRGYTVFATTRNVSSMKTLDGTGCRLLQLDVTDSESIANAVKVVSEATGGRLNILVNNASVHNGKASIPHPVPRPASLGKHPF